MARPKAKELTERELEVMHACWSREEQTVAEIREVMADGGRDLAYTTVATLVRILCDKGYLEQTHAERPFRFRPIRSFEDVSGSLLTDLVQKVFGGSRDQLLVQLMGRKKLTSKERAALEQILREQSK